MMSKPKVLVTGATGKTGGAVVAELLGAGFPVRALVRAQDGRAAALQRAGAEVVVADLFDPDQMLDALRGTQRAYFVPPFHAFAVQSAVTFALAAREAGLEAIVQMSQWVSHRHHPAYMTRQTWLMDHLFADLRGVAHVILNPGMFADNFLRLIDFAALLGVWPMLTGAGKSAPVSTEDIARVAAAVLAAPERHAGMTYRPTGPALLDAREMAAIIAQAVGHRVLPVRMPFRLFLKAARQQGVDPEPLSAFRHYLTEIDRGTFAYGGGVTEVVQELTGRPAEPFDIIARRYAAMPFARQTLGARLRAAARFMAVPLVPGWNLDKWDRQHGFPLGRAPTLAIDDDRWREEHSLSDGRQRPAFA